ncbi:alpha-N-acetylglucosaminidase [Thalassotalea sp. ND16A]|uniref:alpha-N-acetylglucosaminidase n=1 Tax=Thalassotalea sp. ND16A TaxID=1535422 RepID=UPI00051A46EB|nr:alpha-N-acetylglucosaminidase [Thalassotalea sp. ND16A]KGJ92112.1 Alpha-N-acetylglucosaminidase [Thalassotalea sp. ND16A]
MKNIKNYRSAIISLIMLLVCSYNSQAQSVDEFKQNSANLIERLIGKNDIFHIEKIEPKNNKSLFEVELVDKKIVLRGNNITAVASAFHTYLRVTKQAHFSWGRDRVDKVTVPASFDKIVKASPVDLYYQFNFTAHGYSTPYWSWEEWEREIDLMALNGITHPLIISGIESVYISTFIHFGYTEEEIRSWLVLPAHIPWQLMGNIYSTNDAISQSLVNNRKVLGRKIANRLRELDMTPVLPGYYGLVPNDFANRNSASESATEPFILPQGGWAGGYDRPSLINPNQTTFSLLAKHYYTAIEEVFGEVNYFAADPFHEGGKTSGILVPAAANKIQQSMLDHDEDSVWVLQAWHGNPRKDLLSSLSIDNTLVIDLWGDESPAWNRDGTNNAAFEGMPWAWSIIQNFGGNSGLTGNLDTIAQQFSPLGVFNNANQDNLIGLGMAMEGIEQNPVVMDFMFDMRWRDRNAGYQDIGQWLDDYSERRYGATNPHAQAAWRILADTVYHSGPYHREGTIENIFTARPSLTTLKASSWAPNYGPYYNEKALENALSLLVEAGSKLKDIETYQYDLIDVARQVVANKGRKILAKLNKSYQRKNVADFKKQKDLFLEAMLVQDDLLSSIEEFTLSNWLNKANTFADNADDQKIFEENSKRIITTWAPIDSNLQDYSNREWSGLIKDYYYPRWVSFLNYKEALLTGHTEATPPNLWVFEDNWVKTQAKEETNQENLKTPYELAKALLLTVNAQ